QKFEDLLYSRHPQLSRQRAIPLRPAEIASFLPEDTTLLDYVLLRGILGDGTYLNDVVLFVVTSSQGRLQIRSELLNIPSGELQKQTGAFLTACAKTDGSFQASVQAMSDLLLPQVARRVMRSRRRLLICPDGPLWNVPFQ